MLLCIDTSFCPGSAPRTNEPLCTRVQGDCRWVEWTLTPLCSVFWLHVPLCPCVSVLELEDAWPW